MQPIGLTQKNIKYNKFTGMAYGEIMLVHCCVSCGRISCNRIAGDDNGYSVINLLNNYDEIDSLIMDELHNQKIQLLSCEDEQMVSTCLFGKNYKDFFNKNSKN